MLLSLTIGCCDCEELLEDITVAELKQWKVLIALIDDELYETTENETYCARCFKSAKDDELRESTIFCLTTADVPL